MRVRHDVLKDYVQELFFKAGATNEDARFLAESLVITNMRGVDSHGVMRVPIYIERMLNGAAKGNPNTKFIREKYGIALMDGDGGNGIIVSKRAMEKAIDLAKKHGIGIVGVKNSNHFGAAALYCNMAINKNMIGIAMTNVKPFITAPGAKEPVVGNNPFGIGFPTGNEYPFILDMACSVVAAGKFSLAMKKEEEIPLGWAVDKDGNPTTDPKKAFEGYLLPMGGFKGLGIAYAVDIMSGVLTQGAFSRQVLSMYEDKNKSSQTGHFFMAIDIDGLIDIDEFKTRIAEYHKELLNTKMTNEGDRLYFPGEREYLMEKEAEKVGIKLPKNIYNELINIGKQMDVNITLKSI